MMIGSAVEEPDKRARFQSVYGIVAFLDVPVVFLSVRLWQQQGTSSAATHPVLVSISTPVLVTLMLSLVAFTLLYALLMMLRIDIENATNELETLKEARGIR